jgi:hypothetical protein
MNNNIIKTHSDFEIQKLCSQIFNVDICIYENKNYHNKCLEYIKKSYEKCIELNIIEKKKNIIYNNNKN